MANPSELQVGPDRAATLQREGALIVDVREPYEVEAGRIPGARHVELSQLASQQATIDRDRPVIFACRVGGRSALAAQAFRTAGYDAWSLAGGLLAWHERGLPLEPEGGSVAPH